MNSNTTFEHALNAARGAHPWPKRLSEKQARDYLETVHGIKLAGKTMRNKRWQGSGPRWEYMGNRPYTTPQWIDEWVDKAMSDRPANGRRNRVAVSEQPEAA
jgi:hypothetical protein